VLGVFGGVGRACCVGGKFILQSASCGELSTAL